jgi:xanthosine utilization system XapX-like protein
MRRVYSSKHFLISAGLLVGFCIGITQLDYKAELAISNSLLLFASIVVGVAYMPVAWRALRDGQSPTIQHLSLGVAYAWCFGALWRIMTFIWLFSGQPLFMVNNSIISFCQVGVALGALYHVTSPGALGVSYKMRGLAVAGIVLCAMAFAAWMMLSPPDLRWLAELLRPYLS